MFNLNEFVFCIPQNKFIHLPTGLAWKAGGIDALCELAEPHGKFIKPSDCIRENARVNSIPRREKASPLDC